MNLSLYEDALEYYDKALNIDKQHKKLLYYKAMALAFMLKFKEGRKIINKIRLTNKFERNQTT